VSPDPLAIHVPGSGDFNVYAYVRGGALKAIDPLGLEDKKPDGVVAWVLQKVGMERTAAKFWESPVAFAAGGLAAGPAAAVSYEISAGVKKGGVLGGAVAAGKVVVAAHTGAFSEAATVAHAGTQLALRKGNDIANLETLSTSIMRNSVNLGSAGIAGELAALEKTATAGLEGPAATEGVLPARSALVDVFRARARQLSGFSESGSPVILDENISGRGVAEGLRGRGFNVRSVQEIFGEPGIKDPQINDVAEATGAKVLTQDRGRQIGEGFGKNAIQVDARVGADVDALARYMESKGVEKSK
jgi:Domain of unknown function (DUF5615)